MAKAASRKSSAKPQAGAKKAKPAIRVRKNKKQAKGSSAKPSGYGKKIIALVYDFDGTLSPRPMQEYAFLPKIGVDAHKFWAEANRISKKEGADVLITYMHLMYQKAKAAGVVINRDDLVAQGKEVEFYPGVERWFQKMDDYTASIAGDDGVTLRHYLISSGLSEIVEGTTIYAEFHNVFASEYWFDAYELPYPKRVITDTGKTQYLFRINKGLEDHSQSINEHMEEDLRPVPFANMIYFGDGDTDVPSMAVMRKNGGHAIAVHPPGGSEDKCVNLFDAGRVDFYAGADYRPGSDLFQRTCLLIDRIVADIRVREETWHMATRLK